MSRRYTTYTRYSSTVEADETHCLEVELDALSGGRSERLLGVVVEVVVPQPVRGGMGRLSAGEARVEGRGQAGRRLEGAGAHSSSLSWVCGSTL